MVSRNKEQQYHCHSKRHACKLVVHPSTHPPIHPSIQPSGYPSIHLCTHGLQYVNVYVRTYTLAERTLAYILAHVDSILSSEGGVRVMWSPGHRAAVDKPGALQACVQPALVPTKAWCKELVACRSEVGIKSPKGVLLYGPPGTGKTLLARAMAHNMTASFIKASCQWFPSFPSRSKIGLETLLQVVASAIVDKYIGESARIIREMFGYAKEHQPCIIFMDEPPGSMNTQRSPPFESTPRLFED